MVEKLLEEFKPIIRSVEDILIHKRYEEISNHIGKGRLTEKEISDVIKNSGGNITQSPDSYLDTVQMVEVENLNPKQFRVDFDLWIDGKQSDLTLSLTLTKNEDGNIDFSVDDLHVL